MRKNIKNLKSHLDDCVTREDDYITIDPNVVGGKPVFKGTNVPIEELFTADLKTHKTDKFLADHPEITRWQMFVVVNILKKKLPCLKRP